MDSFKDYTDCKYFESEYTGDWHSDVYDHPDYTNYCTRTGEKRKLWCAGIQCNRCGEYKDEEIIRTH